MDYAGIAGQTKVRARSRAEQALIKFVIDGVPHSAYKILPTEYSEYHNRCLREAWIDEDNNLRFEEPGWKSVWLGAGEEKLVYLVVDPHDRAFAVEVITRDGYRHGELIEGRYFGDVWLYKITGQRWHPGSVFSHTFSGRVRTREFIYGETLAKPEKVTGLGWHCCIGNAITAVSRKLALWLVAPRYYRIQRHFHDTHEANVMLELLPLANPEGKSHYRMPLPWFESDGKLGWHFIRLTAIDVRTGR